MGYRLTVETLEGHIIADSKLYGYIEENELKQCKSLQWLIKNHKLDDFDDPYTMWDCNASAEQVLPIREFAEFIALYIIDRNRFFDPKPENMLLIEHFAEAFDYDFVRIGWW